MELGGSPQSFYENTRERMNPNLFLFYGRTQKALKGMRIYMSGREVRMNR
jgi:hypothetical protein